MLDLWFYVVSDATMSTGLSPLLARAAEKRLRVMCIKCKLYQKQIDKNSYLSDSG